MGFLCIKKENNYDRKHIFVYKMRRLEINEHIMMEGKQMTFSNPMKISCGNCIAHVTLYCIILCAIRFIIIGK